MAHEFAPKKPRYDSLEAINQSHGKMTLYGMYFLSQVHTPDLEFSSFLCFQIDTDSVRIFIGYSKLANILYAKELQRHLDAEGAPIIVTSAHPGSIVTGQYIPISGPHFLSPSFRS